MVYIIFMLIKPFSDHSCPVEEGILDEPTPIRIEMIHHRLEVIPQNDIY
jgi:hypothetical protein